jgi:hypothetical protein
MNQPDNKIVIILFAICLLTSCSNSSDATQDSGSATAQDSVPTVEGLRVGFSACLDGASAASARLTRSAGDGELTTELLQNAGFGVYCWYTEANSFTTPSSATYLLMRNQKVEYDGSLTNPWYYSPAKYWPLDQSHKLTFRAYAPYVSYTLVEATVNSYATYVTGMPLLPVVVSELDYQNGTQHDPLWGTGKLVDTSTQEYYPENPAPPEAPIYPDNKRYGTPYDDITYQMSGDKRLENDSRDGFIDWYFHHGMSKILFNCTIVEDPGCDKVTIKRIIIEPLYRQGLLDISSPTEDEDDKPWWYDRDGDMTVNIGTDYLAPAPLALEIPITDPTTTTGPVDLLSEGLLIIPRSYNVSSPMTVTIVYTIDDEDDEADALYATGTINSLEFKGNTVYTLGLTLTPETRGIEISVVQSAYTEWLEGGSGTHVIHNW